MPISRTALIRSTLLAIAVGIGVLLIIIGFNFWLVQRTAEYANIVTTARQQRAAFADLRSLVDDAETAQRGYLLTADGDYLKPYRDALTNLDTQSARVRRTTASNAEQTGMIDRLMPVITAKFDEIKRGIDLHDAGRRDDALALVRTDQGRLLMEQARAMFKEAIERSESNIAAALRSERNSIETLQWVTVGGAIAIVLLAAGAIYMMLMYVAQLAAAQDEVRALNAGLEERVQERTTDLARANEEIQRFAYIVTHDLRAPLVNVMGFTSELETSLNGIRTHFEKSDAENVTPEEKAAREAALQDLPEAVGFIRSSTRKMDGLINAILKLSREGRRVLKPEPIELGPLLENSAAQVQHRVGESGGAVSIEGEAPKIVSDRMALEQIVGNLLDNAVKYRAPERPPFIRVRSRPNGGHRVLIEVEDNGRGIAKTDHERVFDLFRRSGNQDQPGEGIGLAHVRTMVRSLGGDITLDSELGRGTTMTVNLPRDLRRVKGVA